VFWWSHTGWDPSVVTINDNDVIHLEMVRSHLVVGHEVSSVDNLVERSHNSQETTSQKSFTGHFTGTPVNPLWWVRVEFTLVGVHESSLGEGYDWTTQHSVRQSKSDSKMG